MGQQDLAGKATGLDLLMRIAFCVYNASYSDVLVKKMLRLFTDNLQGYQRVI